MIVATRLSSVWQVAGVAAAALCCYLVSQSVATERSSLAHVDRQIATAKDDIAKLTTEIGARGRMGQLERWNEEVLALQAPHPGQFVSDGVQLASLYGRRGGGPALALDPAIAAQQGAIDRVAYQASTPPASVPVAPEAAAPPPAPAIAPAVDEAQPMLRTAAYVRPKADRLDAGSAPLVAAAYHPPVEKPKRSLLPADIGALAAAERAGGRGGPAKAER